MLYIDAMSKSITMDNLNDAKHRVKETAKSILVASTLIACEGVVRASQATANASVIVESKALQVAGRTYQWLMKQAR